MLGDPAGAWCEPRAVRRERRSLEAMAAEICTEYGIVISELVSSQRRSDFNRARDAFAARAVLEGIASQREVAVFLNRSAAAISRSAARGQRAERRQASLDSTPGSAQLCKAWHRLRETVEARGAGAAGAGQRRRHLVP